MAVPGFQDITLPLLREVADGQERSTRDVRERLGKTLHLTADELNEVLPSGHQTRFANRVAWAHVYLKQAGLLESQRRGIYRITSRGSDLLRSPPPRVDIPYLMRYPEFVEFRAARGDNSQGDDASEQLETVVAAAELTPDEQIRLGYQRWRDSLAAQLRARVQEVSPTFFEHLVVELLVAMGYGGSHDDAARVVGRTRDGGIDGIIKEDRLGLESIYVQAKRWDGAVGRPLIQQFAGALQGQRARKGVMITTSTFSKEAIEYARGLQTTIVLIDGAQLAQLMIEYGVGVSDVETVRLKRLDEDYFAEE